jgi:hypothetical protein
MMPQPHSAVDGVRSSIPFETSGPERATGCKPIAEAVPTADNQDMNAVVGSILILIGGVMLGFGPRIARHGVSLNYSYEDLRATSGPGFERVRRSRAIAIAGTMAVGVGFLYAGISSFVS